MHTIHVLIELFQLETITPDYRVELLYPYLCGLLTCPLIHKRSFTPKFRAYQLIHYTLPFLSFPVISKKMRRLTRSTAILLLFTLFRRSSASIRRDQSSTSNQLTLNSFDDFCLYGPPNPFNFVSQETSPVAWCVNGNERLIPDGTIFGVTHVQASDYVQISGQYVEPFPVN